MEKKRRVEGKGTEGKGGENDLTHPCRKFLATPLSADVVAGQNPPIYIVRLTAAVME